MNRWIVSALVAVGLTAGIGGFLAGTSRSKAAPSATPATTVPASAQVAEPKRPEFDGTSPDNFIKSWWAYMGYLSAVARAECREEADSAELKAAIRYAQDALTPAAFVLAEAGSRRTCSSNVLSREIESVKSESETRAVVLATIRNVTPIPTGAVVDKDQLKRRAEGRKFKYVLEKVEGRWKLAQIYAGNEFGSSTARDPKWEPVFHKIQPLYPTVVFEGLVFDLN